MKTFIADIIPKLERYSRKLDELTLLTNQHWVVLDELENKASKNIYIFRNNNELLIANNGKVEKAKWDYLGNNSLLIDIKDNSYLFRHGFFDENVLALKIDGSQEYAILVNENKYEGELNNIKNVIDFLHKTYIKPNELAQIEAVTQRDIKSKKKEYDKPYYIPQSTTEINKNEYTYESKLRGKASFLLYILLTIIILTFIYHLNTP